MASPRSLPILFHGRSELLLRGLLLLFYGCLSLLTLDIWEFTGDEGHTLAAAIRFLESPYWFGPPSTIQVAHLPFVYYLYALAWWIAPSLLAVQLTVVAGHLATHWLLIQIGKDREFTAGAYGASLLAFFNPGLFLFYNQKLWEPALLPLFATLSLWALLRFHASGRLTYFSLSAFSVAVATSGHQLALLLFAPLAFLAGEAISTGSSRRNAALIFGSACALALSPFLLKLCDGTTAWLYPALGVCLFTGAGLFLVVSHRTFVRSLPWALLVLVPFFFLFSFFEEPGGGPIYPLMVLLSGLSDYAPYHVGASAPVDRWWMYILESLLFAMFLATSLKGAIRGHKEDWPLFLWITLPLLLLCGASLLINRYPPHWNLFLFPALVLAMVAGGRVLPVKVLVPGLALLLAGYAYQSLRLSAFVRTSGGIGAHMATIRVKEEVMASIFKQHPNPQVSLAVYPYEGVWWHDFAAWEFLLRQHQAQNPPASGKGPYFYLYQESGLSSWPDLKEQLEAEPGLVRERVGSILIFRSERDLGRIGKKLGD